MEWGEKYDTFVHHMADMEFLEGTTAAGKTTVGVFKFILMVLDSDKTQHILSGLDLGTIEKNIINKPHGILTEFGTVTDYKGGGSAGSSLPHITVRMPDQPEKTIYVLGYADKARWKKALGGQYGCLFIDEINIADMDFVREATMRCDYVMGTLNPDDPDLPVYSEFINKATLMCKDTPEEIAKDITGENKNWAHWFFSFEDNISLDEEKIERIKRNVPEGTKLWKNKVLGLRGKATGLVFSTYDPAIHNVTKDECLSMLKDPPEGITKAAETFVTFTSGLDTSYSNKSADTIAMTFGGITDKGRYILLDCKEYNNRDLAEPLAPTDTVKNYTDFLERNKKTWGLSRHNFIDSADQATITEALKWKRANPNSMFIFENSHKKLRNIDRIELQLGWMGKSEPAFIICEECKPYIRELGVYSWDESKDSTPEDANDHSIQSCQYSWIPYRDRIGK